MKTAGANGGLPPGLHFTYDALDGGGGRVIAWDPAADYRYGVGMLSWNASGMVTWVQVYEDHYQRRGIATAMWDEALRHQPNLHHSEERSESAQAWSLTTAAVDEHWRPTKGMFAPGQDHLDPRVFDLTTERMLAPIRDSLLAALDGYWAPLYGDWRAWARVYLAGSGASYWWDSDADMDILIGVDLAHLRTVRPANREVSDEEILAHLNRGLKEDLRPTTTTLNGFETTWFVNAGSFDITKIIPYAAYDITGDAWIVRPPVLPTDWGPDSIPDSTWRRCEMTAREAQQVLSLPEPDRSIAGTVLFDWVHEGRRAAYSAHGGGWLDPGNVIYQYLTQHPDGLLRALYLCKHPEEVTGAAALTATASGALPDGLEFSVEDGTWQGSPSGKRFVIVRFNGWTIAHLGWVPKDRGPYEAGEIFDVQVDEEFRRMGIATEMLRRAREVDPHVHHSVSLSDDGRAWAQHVGAKTLPDGFTLSVTEEAKTERWGLPKVWVRVMHGGKEVAGLSVHQRQFDGDPGPVGHPNIWVDEEHRRKGLATAMYAEVKRLWPTVPIVHSEDASADAKALNRTLGPGHVASAPEVTYEYIPDRGTEGRGVIGPGAMIEAKVDGQVIGGLAWYTAFVPGPMGHQCGQIEGVYVEEPYQRRGIATEMLRRAREIEPRVHHSHALTEDGRAWSQHVGSTGGTFWRVHPEGRQFGPWDATSHPFFNRDDEPAQEGYSCFANPWHLYLYVELQWGRLYDGNTVLRFPGTRVGTGSDGEDLAVPTGLPWRTTWGDFCRDLPNHPLPDSPKFAPWVPQRYHGSWQTLAERWRYLDLGEPEKDFVVEKVLGTRAQHVGATDGKYDPVERTVTLEGTEFRLVFDPLRSPWWRAIQALVGSSEAGYLTWGFDNTIADVGVQVRYQRRGLATAMLAFAREIVPDLKHSHALTPDGKAWSEKVGSYMHGDLGEIYRSVAFTEGTPPTTLAEAVEFLRHGHRSGIPGEGLGIHWTANPRLSEEMVSVTNPGEWYLRLTATGVSIADLDPNNAEAEWGDNDYGFEQELTIVPTTEVRVTKVEVWRHEDPVWRVLPGAPIRATANMGYYFNEWAWAEYFDRTAGGRGKHDLTKTRQVPTLRKMLERVLADYGVTAPLDLSVGAPGLGYSEGGLIDGKAHVVINPEEKNLWNALHEATHVICDHERMDEFDKDHGPGFMAMFTVILKRYGNVEVDLRSRGPKRTASAGPKVAAPRLLRAPGGLGMSGTGHWDKSGEIPVWVQPHDELLAAALWQWKGDPVDVERWLTRIEAGDVDLTHTNGTAKVDHARAKALLAEFAAEARTNPKPLYRGGPIDTRYSAWTESKAEARRWSKTSGELRVIPAGQAHGLRFADYITSGLDGFEKEWVIRDAQMVAKAASLTGKPDKIGHVAEKKTIDMTPDMPEHWAGDGIYEVDLTGLSTTGCVVLYGDLMNTAWPFGFLTWDKAKHTVEAVYVNEEYRGKGIATYLLKYAEQVAGTKLGDSGEYTTEGFAWAKKRGLNPKMKTRVSKTDMLRMTSRLTQNLIGGHRIKRLLEKVG